VGNLKKDTFICLDVEATGLTVELDEIVEIAVVKFTFDQILDSCEALLDPGMPIPQVAIDVHKITNEMVKGKPGIETILPQVFEMVGNHTVVGHNIAYDISMINQAAKKRHIKKSINLDNTIDTLRLARLYAQSPSNSLEVLRQHFNIEEEGAHRAMNDVIVNIKVFKYLVRDFRTTEEILQRLKEPIEMKAMPLGKHKGLLFRDLPIDYLNWAAHQDFDLDLSFSIEQERRRRKKRKPFSQSSNPFADLL
jgi:DNA polymerase III subunit epsilon